MPVAPHERSEVRLVLGGHKPLGVIEKAKDPLGFALAVSLGNAGSLCSIVKDKEVVFTKPGAGQFITYYYWLLDNGVRLIGLKRYHAEMGRLFGYTEQDIRDFINAEIHCECSKCRGR